MRTRTQVFLDPDDDVRVHDVATYGQSVLAVGRLDIFVTDDALDTLDEMIDGLVEIRDAVATAEKAPA